MTQPEQSDRKPRALEGGHRALRFIWWAIRLMWRNKGYTTLGFVTVACGLLAWAGNTLADMLLYTGRSSKADWQSPAPATCTGWTENTGYRLDPLQRGTPLSPVSSSTPIPQIFDCPDVLRMEADHRMTANAEGLPIHYVVFPQRINSVEGGAPVAPSTPPKQKSAENGPIWVHFHGVNGNYLHGARYLAAAARLGFQLVAAELSNHGTSGYSGKGAAYGCAERADVLAVLGDMLTLEPGRDIFVTASSMGTMALALAEHDISRIDTGHRVVAYALENPISSVKEIVSESPGVPHFPSFLVQIGLAFARVKGGHDFEACKPLESYGSFSRPVLVQHAETDGFAPVSMGKRVYAALPGSLPKLLKVYPAGEHSAVWNSQPQAFESDLLEIWKLGLDHREELRVASKPGMTAEP